MNMPGDYVHDITWAYGFLVVPVWWSRKQGVRWLMLGETPRRWRLSTAFHNCSRTGVR